MTVLLPHPSPAPNLNHKPGLGPLDAAPEASTLPADVVKLLRPILNAKPSALKPKVCSNLVTLSPSPVSWTQVGMAGFYEATLGPVPRSKQDLQCRPASPLKKKPLNRFVEKKPLRRVIEKQATKKMILFRDENSVLRPGMYSLERKWPSPTVRRTIRG